MRPDKRQVIVDGALEVFARDGYTRASMDGIAAHAGVSVRTIYNHFPDKAALFHAVITASARGVAAAHVGLVHRHLGASGGASATGDLDADLTAFALAWSSPAPDHARHFALVRQVEAEAAHIARQALEDWQETGPRRVRRELAARLRAFAGAGLLRADLRDDEAAELAALQLAMLLLPAGPADAYAPAGGRPPAEVRRLVAAGVGTFLHGVSA
jgi:AcrR family transcriptional regulator